jgi:hypothetical protein
MKLEAEGWSSSLITLRTASENEKNGFFAPLYVYYTAWVSIHNINVKYIVIETRSVIFIQNPGRTRDCDRNSQKILFFKFFFPARISSTKSCLKFTDFILANISIKGVSISFEKYRDSITTFGGRSPAENQSERFYPKRSPDNNRQISSKSESDASFARRAVVDGAMMDPSGR